MLLDGIIYERPLRRLRPSAPTPTNTTIPQKSFVVSRFLLQKPKKQLCTKHVSVKPLHLLSSSANNCLSPWSLRNIDVRFECVGWASMQTSMTKPVPITQVLGGQQQEQGPGVQPCWESGPHSSEHLTPAGRQLGLRLHSCPGGLPAPGADRERCHGWQQPLLHSGAARQATVSAHGVGCSSSRPAVQVAKLQRPAHLWSAGLSASSMLAQIISSPAPAHKHSGASSTQEVCTASSRLHTTGLKVVGVDQVGALDAQAAPAQADKVPDLVRAWEVAAAAQFAADGDSSGWDEPPKPLTPEQRYVKVSCLGGQPGQVWWCA